MGRSQLWDSLVKKPRLRNEKVQVQGPQGGNHYNGLEEPKRGQYS